MPDVLNPANSGSNLADVDVASGLDSNDAPKLSKLESAAKLFPQRVRAWVGESSLAQQPR